MSRFILRLLLLLSLTICLTGCPHQSKTTTSIAKPETVALQKYKIRFVFDGLVTLWEPNKTETPGEVWVFVSNASQPSLLPIGQNLRPHRADLLIQDGIQTSGRTLTEVKPNSTSHPHIHADHRWFGTSLDSEELIVRATTSTPLVVARDKGKIPEPCKPGINGCSQDLAVEQKKDLLWAVDLDEVLSKEPSGASKAGRLKRCLRTERYSCEGPISLVATRLHFKNGRVFVNGLAMDEGSYQQYNFPGVPGYAARAIAQEIAVELDVEGPVKIESNPLAARRKKNKGLVIDGKNDQVVEVRIGNHPTIADDDAKAKNLSLEDFLFTYNLFDEIGLAELPSPKGTGPGQNFGSGQCSPNNSTGG